MSDRKQPTPEDLLRALLHISPDDAEKVREQTPGTRRPRKGQEGRPTEDYGSDDQ